MDERRMMAFAFASSIVPASGVLRTPPPVFSYSPTTQHQTPLPKGVPPVKLLGEVSGSVVIGAESVTGIARGAMQWLQVASTLPVDEDADEVVLRAASPRSPGSSSRDPLRDHPVVVVARDERWPPVYDADGLIKIARGAGCAPRPCGRPSTSGDTRSASAYRGQ